MLFRKWGCLVGPENSILRKLKSVDRKKKPLTTEIVLHFYFPFKVFPENERERERARARSIAISRPRSRRRWSRSPVRVRDLQSAIPRRRWSRSPVRNLATPLIAISPLRDHDRRRDLAKIAISDWSWSSRSRTRSSPLARTRARSLSLSHIFRKCFKGKIEV